jgi:hypothetical protein
MELLSPLSPADVERLYPVDGADRRASLRLKKEPVVLLPAPPPERDEVDGCTVLEGVVPSSLSTLMSSSSSSISIIKAENVFRLEDCCWSVFLAASASEWVPTGGGGWNPFRLPWDPDLQVGPNLGRLEGAVEDPLTLLPVKEALNSWLDFMDLLLIEYKSKNVMVSNCSCFVVNEGKAMEELEGTKSVHTAGT